MIILVSALVALAADVSNKHSKVSSKDFRAGKGSGTELEYRTGFDPGYNFYFRRGPGSFSLSSGYRKKSFHASKSTELRKPFSAPNRNPTQHPKRNRNRYASNEKKSESFSHNINVEQTSLRVKKIYWMQRGCLTIGNGNCKAGFYR